MGGSGNETRKCLDVCTMYYSRAIKQQQRVENATTDTITNNLHNTQLGTWPTNVGDTHVHVHIQCAMYVEIRIKEYQDTYKKALKGRYAAAKYKLCMCTCRYTIQ